MVQLNHEYFLYLGIYVRLFLLLILISLDSIKLYVMVEKVYDEWVENIHFYIFYYENLF